MKINKSILFFAAIVATSLVITLLSTPAQPTESYAGAAAFDHDRNAAVTFDQDRYSAATFAGGCFWCLEPPFDRLEGVAAVVSGYTGGHVENPAYEDVIQGTTGHVEAVLIIYDPDLISYRDLLDTFWQQIDPTDDGGQFVDRGSQYQTAIFYHNDEQKRLAELSKESLVQSGRFDNPIVTEIRTAEIFYPAEEYHQGFYQKNPGRYEQYRAFSGRDAFITENWDGFISPFIEEPSDCCILSDTALQEKLTDLQYWVTQQDGTEPPFANEYWDNDKPGIYVDIITGDPLFSSLDKFDSGTGWPSFTKPLVPENLLEREDRSLNILRTEVRSNRGSSHLGHVFDDGPAPAGLRYCINSAALRFIPVEDLVKEGYEKYLSLFEEGG